MNKTLLWLLGSGFYFFLAMDSLRDYIKSLSYDSPYIDGNLLALDRVPAVNATMAFFFFCCMIFCMIKSYRRI